MARQAHSWQISPDVGPIEARWPTGWGTARWPRVATTRRSQHGAASPTVHAICPWRPCLMPGWRSSSADMELPRIRSNAPFVHEANRATKRGGS